MPALLSKNTSDFRLYNTSSRTKEVFSPLKKGEVSFYSCGPTVYNNVHIGNLRAFLFSDTLQRYLKFGKNYSVKWVMNVTDVDDKTIKNSAEKFAGDDKISDTNDKKLRLKKFTELYSQKFFEDLEKLNIKKESFYANPKATDYIAEMQKVVQCIVDNGYGYISEGSVYFDVKKYAEHYKYGTLVHIDFDEMQSTDRVDNDEYEKSSANDFVLWKAKKEGEPSWDFEISDTSTGSVSHLEGRPGWHLECTAMSNEVLGIPFDIHSGGVDLCFPHHEDEIAQSLAAYGKEPANFWVHNEHLMVNGKKMSKSLGNFYTLDDLEKKGFSPEVIRFFLVSNHYRTKVNLSDESLKSSEQMLKRIRNFLEIGHANASTDNTQKFLDNFFSALDDDLNVSVALAEFFNFVKTSSGERLDNPEKSNPEISQKFLDSVKVSENIFGISFLPKNTEESSIPENIQELLELRKKAREEKNWKKSDEIRDKISDLGYEVRDGKSMSVKKM